MDFSSVPVFLDPPRHQQGITNQPSSGLVPTDPLQILPPPAAGSNGGGSGSDPGLIRPGSMFDRTRLARLSLPEAGLKCPRCESTNTKFCYFNNYNLSQPRHFCKACRRYWTHGGALRNVPVGGGCQRNKRSKARSKTGSKTDPVSTQNIRRGGINNTTSQLLSSSDNNTSANDLSSQVILPPPQPDPFLLGLHHINGFGSGFGLNLGGGGPGEVEQLSSLLAGSGVTGSGLYPFDEISIPDHTKSGFVRVKLDENHQGLNLSKNSILGVQGSNIGDQTYSSWGGGINGWADISGFHGSSSYDGSIN